MKSPSTPTAIFNKLKILTDAAKYDVACTSSGVSRKGVAGSQGLRRPLRERPLKDLQPWAPDPSLPWLWAWGWIRRRFGREWSKSWQLGV